MIVLPCLRCGAGYEQQRRRASHFCPPCRAVRRREGDTARKRKVRAAAKNDWHVPRGVEPLHAERLHTDDGWRVLDRVPAGANSPAGPDEGTSTYFGDLADELNRRSREVANHPWFSANPHWAYKLHDDETASRYMGVA